MFLPRHFRGWLRAVILATLLVGGILSGVNASPALPAKDPYITLGVARSVSPEVIRERYRELLKRFHPDRAVAHGLALARATAITQELNAAYAWLKANHIPVAAPPPATSAPKAAAPAKLEVDAVLRFAWGTGMNAAETLRGMSALGGALAPRALLDQWFDAEKSNADFLLLYLE